MGSLFTAKVPTVGFFGGKKQTVSPRGPVYPLAGSHSFPLGRQDINTL